MRLWLFVAAILTILGGFTVAMGQAPGIARPMHIDEAQVITLAGNVHPLAHAEFEQGVVAPETRLAKMVLQLESSPQQQAELDTLVEAQHDPASPLFHQWLTPAEYGARFGLNPQDLARVAAWLAGHGFQVDEIAPSNRLIVFSGTAGQVADAFHTEIHRYRVDGVEHIANAQDPQIPAALAGVVGGVVSLHDFRRTSQIATRRPLPTRTGVVAHPQYSAGSTHYLFPADFAQIYDLNPLYSAGMTGAGISIAIVGRSNINASDVATFRSMAGLPANSPTVILAGANPGLVGGDQDEATLDVEWSGAVAPAATIKFVVGASTATTDGIDLSSQYIVNHTTAPVVSLSYGGCEQSMGTAELAFYNALWEQAASQGMSVFVASGDAGAAGCGSGSDSSGSMAGVNGLCSSPYSTCVGGTEFNEGSNSAQYWATTNSTSSESALGYIPEEVWNESASNGGSGLWSSGGGISTVYAQPAWQKGVSGIGASNGMRAVPDVALSSAGHDGYFITENGAYWIMAGTSAAAPSFAGIMVLLVESKSGTGQGDANSELYTLAEGQPSPFHPTPSGSNTVTGVTGFTASGATYNLATGLGSVDGAVLVNSWSGNSGGNTAAVDFTLTPSASSATVLTGKSTTFSIKATESGAGKNSIALTAKAPTGVTVSFNPSSILPGATSTATVAVGATAVGGTQSVTITGKDATGTLNQTFALTVTLPPTLALTAASSSVSVVQGATGAASLTATTAGSYTGNIALSVSGLPTGVTATWSANPISSASGASTNKETLTLTAASTAKVASATIVVSAVEDGLTAKQSLTLQVQQAPGVTMSASPASVSVKSLASASVTIAATPLGGAVIPAGASGSRIGITSGLPKGFTASWSAPSLTTAGAVTWTLTLTGSSTAVAGSSTLSLSGTVAAKSGTAYPVSLSLPMSVTLSPPTLSLSVAGATASASISVVQGKSATQVLTLTGNATYSGAVTLSVSGLPAGVTASWSKNPVTLSAESGSTTLALTAASSAKVGTATITVTASGDGLTAKQSLTLQVQQGPAAQLALGASSLSMVHTGTGSTTATVTAVGGFSAPVTLSVSGLPAGVKASFSTTSFAAPGSGSSTLTLSGSSTAKAGTTALTVTASTAGSATNTGTTTATQSLSLVLR